MSVIKKEIPAESFEEGFALGNGRLGVKVYGSPSHKIFSLNEESIWSQEFVNRNNPSGSKNFNKIKKYIQLNQFSEAQELAFESLSSTPKSMSYFKNAGELHIDFYNAENYGLENYNGVRKNPYGSIQNYSRELDLSTAIETTSFTSESSSPSTADFSENSTGSSINLTQETFVSVSQDVLVVHISASIPKSIFLRARFENDEAYKAYACSDDTVVVQNKNGIPYVTMITAVTSGGKVSTRGDNLIVENADDVVLYIDVESAYRKMSYRRRAFKRTKSESLLNWCTDLALKKLCFASSGVYTNIKNEHIRDYSSVFEKNSIQIENNEDSETFLNLCKYLLISSHTKKSVLPPLPKSLWYKGDEDYGERKINLEKLPSVLFTDFIASEDEEKHLINFTKLLFNHATLSASSLYDLPGAVIHSATNIWGDSAPDGNDLRFSFKNIGALYFAEYLLDYYEFTQNKEFLKKVFKYLKTVCKFIEVYVTVEENKETVYFSPYFCECKKDGLFFQEQNPSVLNLIASVFSRVIEAAENIGKETDIDVIGYKHLLLKMNCEKLNEKANSVKSSIDNADYSLFCPLLEGIVSSKIVNHRVEISLLENLAKGFESGNIQSVQLRGNIFINLSWTNGVIKEASVFTKSGRPYIEEITLCYKDKSYKARVKDGFLDLLNVLPSTVTE